ncbi:MAG: zinc ABC transporter substrate-binding protein [Thermoguttaceae bacterium]|nr:zinc ABC transporter substrate-binding protein [Thermoguttaceae bacterium]
MSHTKRKHILTFAALFIVLAALILILVEGYLKLRVGANSQREAASSRVAVLVAVDPIAYLAERVGGQFVDVAVLTPQGKDPESFAPTPKQLADVASTRIFFRVGLPIEDRFGQNVDSIAPGAETVDLSAGLELMPEHDGHASNEGGEESGESLDPHLWTSPANAIAMVASIADALVAIDPDHTAEYRLNEAALNAELTALQQETADRLAPYEGRAFVVFHPAYGYYAREFHLTQLAIESEGKAPRPRELEELVERVKKDGVRKLIVQPEFNRSSAQVVADEIGGELVEHSPLEKDYFANLRSLTDAIVGSFAAPEE